MCTVTYLPTGTDRFIFTSNRDEFINRSASELIHEQRFGKNLIFPQDTLAKGTWIAISDQGQLVCILNGAYKKHKRTPPYRLSRGVMALEFFKYDDAPAFFQHFDFTGIEPFTMVIIDRGKLFDFRWDEAKKHIDQKDTSESHIWASCTLYSEEWQQKRIEWFTQWQSNNPSPEVSDVIDFHTNAGEGDLEYDIVMNKSGIVRTTSISSIEKVADQMTLRFESLMDQKVKHSSLDLLSAESHSKLTP